MRATVGHPTTLFANGARQTLKPGNAEIARSLCEQRQIHPDLIESGGRLTPVNA